MRDIYRKIGLVFAVSLILAVAAILNISTYCLAQNNAADFVNEAKSCIKSGQKDKAVSALDSALKAADTAGDCKALMEIGDLYISIDKNLSGKAMDAWTKAGHWKCK